jgi:hypothetical protein
MEAKPSRGPCPATPGAAPSLTVADQHIRDRVEHRERRRPNPLSYCVLHSWSSRSSVLVMAASHAWPLSTAWRTLSGESVQS